MADNIDDLKRTHYNFKFIKTIIYDTYMKKFRESSVMYES